jgi:hypothetical protein
MGIQTSGTTSAGVSSPYFKNYSITGNIIYKRRGRWVDLSSAFTEIENILISDNEIQFLIGSDEIIRHRDWVGSGGNRFSGFTYTGNKYYSTNDFFSPGPKYTGWLIASGETNSAWGIVPYPDPDRDISTYMTSIGQSGGEEEFMAVAVNMGRHNWDVRFTAAVVNNYIREGFGREPRHQRQVPMP